jgi:hypothetical protein
VVHAAEGGVDLVEQVQQVGGIRGVFERMRQSLTPLNQLFSKKVIQASGHGILRVAFRKDTPFSRARKARHSQMGRDSGTMSPGAVKYGAATVGRCEKK